MTKKKWAKRILLYLTLVLGGLIWLGLPGVAAGGVYVTGEYSADFLYCDVITLGFDNASGANLWQRGYDGPAGRNDGGLAVAVDGAGNVIVAGYTANSSSDQDYLIIKYNASGAKQWIRRYQGPAGLMDHATSVAVDTNGNVYVTGESADGTGPYNLVTIKYGPNGYRRWVRTFPAAADGDDSARLVLDAGGNVIVSGKSWNGSDSDYLTIKYDNDGNMLWSRRYAGPAGGDDSPVGVGVDAAGNVYVGGTSSNGSNNDFLIRKYDANGVHQWCRRYNSPADRDDDARGFAVDGTGNVYLTGRVDNGVNYDCCTLMYDTLGNLVWEQTFNRKADGNDYPRALAVDAGGNVFITGASAQANYDYLTIKYSATGTQEWVRFYNGQGNLTDYAQTLAVDGAGNVYVTGRSRGSTNDECVTIKYDPDGTKLWLRRFKAPINAPAYGFAIAVNEEKL